MGLQVTGRGEQLVSGGWKISGGPRWLAHALTGGVDRLLDRLDRGLERGSIHAVLPGGIQRTLGGKAAGFDAVVRIHSYRALVRMATGGSVGWFQAWEDGEWESPDLVPLFALFMANASALGDLGRAQGPWRWVLRIAHWFNRNTRSGSLRNIGAHYDLGNDFYAAWLDQTMSYSSGRYIAGEDDLEAAQRNKIASIAERLAGVDTVLEIGCGWGSLASHLAKRGADVTAISLSDEQLAWASAQHASESVHFRKQDYRDIDGRFAGIASVEMVEAVGRHYWPAFFDTIARCLVPGGKAALQFISMRDDLFEDYARGADFIQTYIFPGGLLVQETEFRRLAEQRGMSWEDREGFGQDYARTLQEWRLRFDRAVEEHRLPAGFDQRFVNLWRYYLMYCEAGFRGGGIDVAQVTMVKQR